MYMDGTLFSQSCLFSERENCFQRKTNNVGVTSGELLTEKAAQK